MSNQLAIYRKVRQDELLNFFEQQYFTDGELLSAERLRQCGWDVSDSEYFEWYNHPDTILSLGLRGINLPPAEISRGKFLNAVQLAVANEIMGGRSKTQVLKKYGVTNQQWIGWCKDPSFYDYINRLSGDVFKTAAPEVKMAHLRQIDRGNVKAMELFYEINGEINRRGANSAPTINLEYILMRVAEAATQCFSDRTEVAAFVEKLKEIAATPNGRQIAEHSDNTPQFSGQIK